MMDVIGDQPWRAESQHSRRARFHQSWYRAYRLKVAEWGTTFRGRPLGSILPADAAAAGKNFTTLSAAALFTKRHAAGWGIDPVRTTSYMTSSQTLLLNLFGPIGIDHCWLLMVLRRVLDRPDLLAVNDWAIEFAPPARSQFLGDMTRVDAYIQVQSAAGAEAIVLELKYTDRFSSRRVNLADNSRYKLLAEETQAWTQPDAAFKDVRLNQLVRCHALGMRSMQVEFGEVRPTTLLVVAHTNDLMAVDTVTKYRSRLNNPASAVYASLSEFLEAGADSSSSEEQLAVIDELRARYIAHGLSEEHWMEFKKRAAHTSR
jgi:hypothetical protein